MRKLLVGLLIGVGMVLASCGGPSLSKQESKAVVDVEQTINQTLGTQSYSNEQVIGQVAKDTQGNKVTLVYVQATDPTVKDQAKAKWSLIVIVVENSKGQLVFADADVPSNIVTVVGPGAN